MGYSLFWAGGRFLIGERGSMGRGYARAPESASAFLAFASNQEYMSGMGHRVAALEDSRLLPLVEGGF